MSNELKSPPHNETAEAAVLGSILRDPSLLATIRHILVHPSMFYIETNATIYRTMCAMADTGSAIDAVLLYTELKQRDLLNQVGGKDRIHELWDSVPTTAHAEWYAASVKEKASLRSVIQACHDSTKDAYECEGPSYTVVSALQTRAAQIAELGMVKVGELAREYLDEAVAEIDGTSDVQAGGLPTGIPPLDAVLKGMKKKQLICIAGHTKHGKTSLALQIVGTVGLACLEPVAVISYEMTAQELTKKLILTTCEVPEHILARGGGNPNQRKEYGNAIQAIRDCRIVLDDDCPPHLAGVATRLQYYRRRHGISLAMIDYYQLMEGSDTRNRRYDQLVEVSRGLKKLASEIDIPIIVLAQLNAEAEKEDRMPRLNDIEECKRISKDANVVLLLDWEYRRKRNDSTWTGYQHLVTVDVAGIRHGAGGVVKLKYDAPITRFREWNALEETTI